MKTRIKDIELNGMEFWWYRIAKYGWLEVRFVGRGCFYRNDLLNFELYFCQKSYFAKILIHRNVFIVIFKSALASQLFILPILYSLFWIGKYLLKIMLALFIWWYKMSYFVCFGPSYGIIWVTQSLSNCGTFLLSWWNTQLCYTKTEK